MKHPHIALCLCLAIAAPAANVMAAQSVSLSVEGTISPAPCSFTLQGGSNLNFGNVSIDDLGVSEGDLTLKELPELDVRTLTVECPTMRQFAIKAVDNGEGAGQDIAARDGVFSLGLTAEGKTPAWFMLNIDRKNTLIDGQPVKGVMMSLNHGETWGPGKLTAGDDYMVSTASGTLVGFSNNSSTGLFVPSPAKAVVIPMKTAVIFSPKSVLGVSDTITLRGSATFELVYL